MAGNILAVDKDGMFYLPFGPPFNIGIPRTACRRSVASIQKPATPKFMRSAFATASAATVDPRSGRYWFTENARDWMSDDIPT